jgi:hypothetical protein
VIRKKCARPTARIKVAMVATEYVFEVFSASASSPCTISIGISFDLSVFVFSWAIGDDGEDEDDMGGVGAPKGLVGDDRPGVEGSPRGGAAGVGDRCKVRMDA